jgi:hypothetical protein
MRRISPFPVLVGEVSLEVREARLDDHPLPYNMLSSTQRVVALHQVERENWRTAELSVEIRAPEHELGLGPWRDIACVAVLSERRTNTRTVVPLRMQRPGEWQGEIQLHRDHHRGRAELTGQVISTVDGVPGRVIGTVQDRWTVDLQATAPARRDEIKARWLDFRDERNPQLHPFKNDPWTVEAAGDEPVLYLNRGFDGLEPLLNGDRTSDRPAREAVAAQVAVDVWMVLFNAAAYHAEADEDVPGWPGGWREATLRRMLPAVFPERSPNDALVEVVNRRRSGDGGGDLQTRLLNAAAKQARMPRYLGGLLRTINRTGQEEA